MINKLKEFNAVSSSISSQLKEHLCFSMARLIQDLRANTVVNTSNLVQVAVSELVEIIRNSSAKLDEDSESRNSVGRAAWYTFGEIIRDTESLKTFVGRSIGYENLANILIQANVLVDRDAFDVLLELACHSGSGGTILTSDEISVPPHVMTLVRKVTNPSPLFTRLYEHSSREPNRYSFFFFCCLLFLVLGRTLLQLIVILPMMTSLIYRNMLSEEI